MRTGALVVAVLLLFGCGATSSVVQGGATHVPATATAKPTATKPPTPTPKPTSTPTPGHLLVTVNPNQNSCGGGSSCASYVCHNGTTCTMSGPCVPSGVGSITLSNSGQATLKWQASVTFYPGNAPTTVTPANGTLAGGASINLAVNPGAGGTGVFTGAAQTVTIEFDCGIP